MEQVIDKELPKRTEDAVEEPSDGSEDTGEGTKRALGPSLVPRPREDLAGLVPSRCGEAAR
jgi:hypothetical protein